MPKLFGCQPGHHALAQRIHLITILAGLQSAVVDALPIVLGLGAGAELRQPLGVAIVGGLLVSQVITLFLDRYCGAGPLTRPQHLKHRHVE